jgi:transcriptional regulator with XRE-family HTH domain
MDLRQIFAENLVRLRKQNKLSQEALAADAGIDRTYVSSLERCVYSPSLDMIEKLAGALGVDPPQMLTKIPGRRR